MEPEAPWDDIDQEEFEQRLETMINPCEYQVRPARYFDPPEYCELDSVPGEIYCSRHLAMIQGEWDA